MGFHLYSGLSNEWTGLGTKTNDCLHMVVVVVVVVIRDNGMDYPRPEMREERYA